MVGRRRIETNARPELSTSRFTVSALLAGPPGTSKTFIAQQFARYFVRQRAGQMQGAHHMLYMHAAWSYEDFFEGVRPVTRDGNLLFEPKKGFFLDWVTDNLKGYDLSARHVLVLDEINRCDTAAVLGELLQLLEYRGITVRLLSGRQGCNLCGARV
jgi:5-methylcytosine-specific restriction protein B